MNLDLPKFFHQPNTGVFFIRVVAGAILAAAGISKFLGGQAALEGTGRALGMFGVDAGHLYFGIAAAVCETLGGIALVLGFKARIAALCTFAVMAVASAVKVASGADLVREAGYPIMVAAVCLGIMFTGAGRWSVDP